MQCLTKKLIKKGLKIVEKKINYSKKCDVDKKQ